MGTMSTTIEPGADVKNDPQAHEVLREAHSAATAFRPNSLDSRLISPQPRAARTASRSLVARSRFLIRARSRSAVPRGNWPTS